MILTVNHVTHYRYDRPVTLGPQIVRLRPAPHCRSKIISYSLKIEPALHFINWQQDPFANWQARLVFPEKTTEFTVTIDLVAEMAVFNPFDFFLEESAQHYPFDYDTALRSDLEPYLRPVEDTSGAVAQWIDHHRLRPGQGPEDERTIDFLVRLNQAANQAIAYTTRLEVGVQTPEQTLDAALASPPLDCRGVDATLKQVGEACKTCHQDFRG